MGYQSVIVANPARLSARNNRLCIDNGETAGIPLEDIRCLMLESAQISLTSALLARLAESGITVFVCDGKHLPKAVFQPVSNHSRQLRQLRLQMNQTLPAKKRLWRQIVAAKVANQAKCLDLAETAGGKALRAMVPFIKPGDPQNVEGRAAAFYFKALFGSDFARDDENEVNAALNYGYALFRGVAARTLAVYGFEPCLGLHHASELNNYNLADDLMEPFRPLVDLYVFLNRYTLGGGLTTAVKANLLDLANAEVLSGSERHSAAYAVERLVQSLAACLGGQKEGLVLPALTGLARHEYE